MANFIPAIHVILAVVLSPLLLGVINRTKAIFAGRRGQPLLQPYFDLIKLMNKAAVYSRTTTWVFRAGPVIGLASALACLPIVPLGGVKALSGFEGDLVLFAYLFGLMRFITVLAAMDTGSAFEGMGASREVQLSALAEPALLVRLGAMALKTGSLSLTGIYGKISTHMIAAPDGPVGFLVGMALLIVFLTENARIPVDDPNTHLELTMIHEVMVLDHGGVDFAMIQYGAALKLWILGTLLTGVFIPVRTQSDFLNLAAGLAGMFLLAIVVGVIESTMARLRLIRLPQMLVAAVLLSTLAFVWILR